MATPHDDDAPPPIFDTADGERETPLSGPIVMAPPTAPDTVTTADLDLVDRLDGALHETTPGAADFARRAGAVDKLATMAPRLARSVRRASSRVTQLANLLDLAEKERAAAYARGRREAIEEAARYLESWAQVVVKMSGETDNPLSKVLSSAAIGVKKHEAERRSK